MWQSVGVHGFQVEDWEPTSPKAKDVLGTDGYIAPEAYLGPFFFCTSSFFIHYCISLLSLFSNFHIFFCRAYLDVFVHSCWYCACSTRHWCSFLLWHCAKVANETDGLHDACSVARRLFASLRHLFHWCSRKLVGRSTQEKYHSD